MEKSSNVLVGLPNKLIEFLDKDCKNRGRSRVQHIREILFDYKDRVEKESK